MNWLFYLGGGWLFLGFIESQCIDVQLKNNFESVKLALRISSAIMVWIWFCWTFIK